MAMLAMPPALPTRAARPPTLIFAADFEAENLTEWSFAMNGGVGFGGTRVCLATASFDLDVDSHAPYLAADDTGWLAPYRRVDDGGFGGLILAGVEPPDLYRMTCRDDLCCWNVPTHLHGLRGTPAQFDATGRIHFSTLLPADWGWVECDGAGCHLRFPKPVNLDAWCGSVEAGPTSLLLAARTLTLGPASPAYACYEQNGYCANATAADRLEVIGSDWDAVARSLSLPANEVIAGVAQRLPDDTLAWAYFCTPWDGDCASAACCPRYPQSPVIWVSDACSIQLGSYPIVP
ncbi:MAG: hypothetical protein U0610_20755 [bacterium]